MGDSYYPAAYGGGQLDFSGIQQAAKGIAGGLTDMWDRQAVQGAIASATGPGGEVDYNKAFGNLLAAGRTKEAQVIANYAESQTMNQYRQDSLKPDAQRLYEWAYPGSEQSQQQPEAVPGPTPTPVQTTPLTMSENGTPTPQEFLTSRNKTSDPYTIAKEKKRAEYDAYKATKMSQAPNLKAGLRDLKAIADSVDDASFENALGPLQGAEAGDIVSGYALQIPRLAGEAWNKYEGGTTPPTEVRNMVTGGAQALSAAIKPLVRAPGEGIWTDKDQELLDRIVGNLAESRTKPEYIRRLQGVANRVRSNFGIDISGWDAKEGSEAATATADPWASPSAPSARAPFAGAGAGAQGQAPAGPHPVQPGSPQEQQVIQWAREAISNGADPAAVEKRLREMGYGQ
jgi:hypothetical protein